MKKPTIVRAPATIGESATAVGALLILSEVSQLEFGSVRAFNQLGRRGAWGLDAGQGTVAFIAYLISGGANPELGRMPQLEKAISMRLNRIRLELARTADFPEGNPNYGYEFVAPLDYEARLDAEAWLEAAQLCTLRHFVPGAEDVHGELIYRGNGEWAFSYRPGDADDEVIYHLREHLLREGEYVSVTEQDGVVRPFRVVSIEALHIVPKVKPRDRR